MSNNSSNSNSGAILAGIKEAGHKVFGGYAELLRIPHTARYSIGSVIACMPFPMVGMTITISVQHYYGNYSLAGMLTAIQAIALAVATPLLGKLTDKFGQRQVSIPTIIVWIVAAIALVTAITNRAPEWVLYCLTPFLAAIPPWGAMSRARWTKILKGDRERTNRALSLCGVLDECMWVIGNPLASTLAVISGLLAFSFTGMCVVIGALMFLTELTTEPPSQTALARAEGISRKEYREREAAKAEALKAETAAEETRRRLEREGVTDEATINAAIKQAVADARSGKKASIWGPGLIAVCVTWFGLGAFQSATGISIIAFATEANMKQYTGFVFACFSFSSLMGALVYGAKNWSIALWKRFYFCLAVVNIGISRVSMTQICGWGKIRRKLCATMDNTSFDEGFAGNATSAGNIQSGAERSVVLLCPTTCPTRTPLWLASRKWVTKFLVGMRSCCAYLIPLVIPSVR